MDDLALVAHVSQHSVVFSVWITALWLFVAKILVCWRNLQQLICPIYPLPPSHPCLDISTLSFYVTYTLPFLHWFFQLDSKILDFQMAFHKPFALALISTSCASPSRVFHIPLSFYLWSTFSSLNVSPKNLPSSFLPSMCAPSQTHKTEELKIESAYEREPHSVYIFPVCSISPQIS